MKMALVLAVLLCGCTVKVSRIEFSCVTVARDDGQIQTDCADLQSWKEYLEKQHAQTQKESAPEKKGGLFNWL